MRLDSLTFLDKDDETKNDVLYKKVVTTSAKHAQTQTHRDPGNVWRGKVDRLATR